ncbi:MAG: NlpC/P60 family protein [Faecousia sp.]
MNVPKKIFSLFLVLVLFAGCIPIRASAADNIFYGIGYITMADQCLYSKPTSRSSVLVTTNKNDCVIITKEYDELWYKVIYNDQAGYMYAGCLDVHTEADVELGYGRINPGVAYLRSGPGMEYSLVSSGFKGNEHYIVGMYNGWYKILKDNATCYIRSDLMTLKEIPYQNEASENSPKFYYMGEEIGEITFAETEQVILGTSSGYSGSISGSSLLAVAQQFIGTPYVFGGASPDGFDCSGLVYYCLTLLGYSSYRTAADQYNMGYSIDSGSLQAGDLVFFANTYQPGISHVGIYAGGGQFLHAPGDGGSVCYSSLSGYWADHYYGARRLG